MPDTDAPYEDPDADVSARVFEAWREAARRAWRAEQTERVLLVADEFGPWWGPSWP